MMNSAQRILAKRYAQAFLALNRDFLTPQHIEALESLLEFLQGHTYILYFCTLSHIDTTTKEKVLDTLLRAYALQEIMHPLLSLLIKSKRVFLFPDIGKQISLLYKEYKKIKIVTVTTSHALENEELTIIKNFLSRQTGYDSKEIIKIDKNLIAGIRLQSDIALWEYSLRKQLKNIELSLIR